MATVYVLIGLQGSGKSTWARRQAGRLNAGIVASDAIRNELEATGLDAARQSDQVFSVLEDRVARALNAGRNVIVDATHIRRQWRQKVVALARRAGARVVAVWFDVPLNFSLARNARRPGGGGWGDRVVPKRVLIGMWRSFERPTLDEFDEIWRYTEETVGV